MTQADQLMTLGAIRAIELQRVATWILREILADLRRLEQEVLSTVMSLAREQPETRRDKLALERRIEVDTGDLIDAVMSEIQQRIEAEFDEIIKITEQEEKQNFKLIYGLSLFGSAKVDGSNLLVMGATVEDHMSKIAEDLKFRTMSQIRDSIAAGEAEELLYRRLKGGQTVETPPGEFGATETRVGAVVRTGATSIPNSVQVQLEPSQSVISPHGWQHISVLDSRTTAICRGRAFLRWDDQFRPIGHDTPFRQPPLHANCRSRIQLIFIDAEPAQDVNFRQWTERLTKQQRDEVFGAQNIKRWESSKMSDAELIRQENRPMTVTELAKRTETKQGEFPFL